jgi:hypothetical protein
MKSVSIQIWKLLICCIIGFSAISGCVHQNPKITSANNIIPPDPESGIQNWIDAVNSKNVSRLYDLAPGEIKKQVNEQQFKLDNHDNLILKPGLTFKPEFTEITKSVNRLNATIKAQLFLQNSNELNGSTSEIAVQYIFYLFFENGEWKVWT